MNDQDRDLIKQILQSAGKAGEKGFSYLVHWQLLDGILSLAGFGVAMCGALWLIRRAFKWNPEEDEGHVVRGATIAALCTVCLFLLCGMINGLRDALAPEGAAIYVVLHH